MFKKARGKRRMKSRRFKERDNAGSSMCNRKDYKESRRRQKKWIAIKIKERGKEIKKTDSI